MNKFVTSALALAAAGSVSYADPGDDEWLELDSEINNLATALQPSSQDGMGWAALLRFTYSYSSDDIATGAGDDLSGFKFEDIRLAFWGSVAEYGYRISMDVDPDDAEGNPFSDVEWGILDAFAFWDCGGYVTATAGQFRASTFRSNMVYAENQFFIDRTAIGSAHDFWDMGIQADGNYEAFTYWVSIQNGVNGQESDHYYSARVQWDFNAGAGMNEGARGGNDELNLTAGASYVNNDSGSGTSDDSLYGLDVWGNFSSFGFGAEVAFLDDDAFRITSPDLGRGVGFPLIFEGDTTPWAIFGSFLINPEWEVGARYETLDNDEGTGGDDNSILSVAVVWYRSGNNAKWTAQWSDYDGDTLDGSVFQLGLTLGAQR